MNDELTEDQKALICASIRRAAFAPEPEYLPDSSVARARVV